jgi:hypothetical protein
MVGKCNSEHIVKIDPEFVFVTPYFVKRALHEITKDGNKPYMSMPLPIHARSFDLKSLDNIKSQYRFYKYDTHIKEHTAQFCNVYYGCVFSRSAYIELGGVDHRFNGGIGSEDDHLMREWRRVYGPDSVKTFTDEIGVHLWHDGFAGGVPSELYGWVNMNADLCKRLFGTRPNNGEFSALKFPDMGKIRWEKGIRVE